MFSFGMNEILIILAVALVVVGPKKLPDLAKTLGKGMREVRKATEDIKQSFTEDETYKEFKKASESVKDTMDGLKLDDLNDVEDLLASKKPETDLGPRKELLSQIAEEHKASEAETKAQGPEQAAQEAATEGVAASQAASAKETQASGAARPEDNQKKNG